MSTDSSAWPGVESMTSVPCEFSIDRPPTYSQYRYVVQYSDVQNAVDGRQVMERICAIIWGQKKTPNDAKEMWTLLAAANKHVLKFYKHSTGLCYPALKLTVGMATDALCTGYYLEVPSGWPTSSLKLIGLAPGFRVDQRPQMNNLRTSGGGSLTPKPSTGTDSPQLSPSGQEPVQSGPSPSDEDDSTSTLVILGLATLAAGGIWWMMSNKR